LRIEEAYKLYVDETLLEKSETDNEETLKIKSQLKKMSDFFKVQLVKLKEKMNSLIPDTKTTGARLFDHIIAERKTVLDNKKSHANPMSMFNMLRATTKTSWHNVMVNSYFRALKIRGNGTIGSLKLRLQR